MFSIIFFFNLNEAMSNSCTADLLKDHPTEPKFSSAWTRFLAPGIGTVPLHIAQLIATWDGVLSNSLAIARRVPNRGCAPGNSSRKSCRRGFPGRGRLSKSYFPLNKPKHSGEYDINRHPASLHASNISLFRAVIRVVGVHNWKFRLLHIILHHRYQQYLPKVRLHQSVQCMVNESHKV